MNSFANPAIWALVALIAWPLSLVIGTLLTRGYLQRMNDIAEEIDGDPRANDSDRVWLSRTISDAIDWRQSALAAVMAPSLPVIALLFSIDMMRKEPESLEDARREHEALGRRLDALEVLVARETGAAVPSHGFFWNDPRRQEMRDDVVPAAFLKHPILLVWIALWAVPALIVLLATGGVRPATNFFRSQVWPMIYRWLATLIIVRGTLAH